MPGVSDKTLADLEASGGCANNQLVMALIKELRGWRELARQYLDSFTRYSDHPWFTKELERMLAAPGKEEEVL